LEKEIVNQKKMQYKGKAKLKSDDVEFFYKGQVVNAYAFVDGEYDNMSDRRFSKKEYEKYGLRDMMIVSGKESAIVYSHEIEMI